MFISFVLWFVLTRFVLGIGRDLFLFGKEGYIPGTESFGGSVSKIALNVATVILIVLALLS